MKQTYTITQPNGQISTVEANNPYSYLIREVDPDVFHWVPVTMYYDTGLDSQHI